MRILIGDMAAGTNTDRAMRHIVGYGDSDVICLQGVPDKLRTPILTLEDRLGRVIQIKPGVNSAVSIKNSVSVTSPLDSVAVVPSSDKKNPMKGTYLHFLTLTFKGYFYFIGEYEGLPDQQDPALVKQSELLLTGVSNVKEKVVLLVNLHTDFRNIGMKILEQKLVNVIKAHNLASEGMSIFVSSDVIVKDVKRFDVEGARFFFGDFR